MTPERAKKVVEALRAEIRNIDQADFDPFAHKRAKDILSEIDAQAGQEKADEELKQGCGCDVGYPHLPECQHFDPPLQLVVQMTTDDHLRSAAYERGREEGLQALRRRLFEDIELTEFGREHVLSHIRALLAPQPASPAAKEGASERRTES